MCEHHDHEKQFFDTIIGIGMFVMSFSYPEPYNLFLLIPSYLLAGGSVLWKAVKNIFRGRVFDENFLMSIATIGALLLGKFHEAFMVMVLYQIGEYLQHRAVDKSKHSINELLKIRPEYAFVERDGRIKHTAPHKVSVGEVVAVRPGQKIPLDGIVVEGQSLVDTSPITGESVPRLLSVGDSALCSYINKTCVLRIRVTKDHTQTTAAKIIELVKEAAKRKSKAEKFITKFARYYTPVVFFGALLLAIVPPLFTGQYEVWFSRALIFLVISCPCALVISVPLGFFAGLGGASRAGILIKGSCYIEALSKPYAIFFDKTGTLTKGSFEVTQINPAKGTEPEQLLEFAAMAEFFSSHPIAESIKKAYKNEIDSGLVTDISEIAGCGIKANVNGAVILAGNYRLMDKFNIEYTKPDAVGSIVYVAKDNEFLGSIVISDEIKEDAFNTVEQLKSEAKVVMLTGDSADSAEMTAEKLGIDEVYSQLLPADKVQKVEEYISKKTEDKSVIFVGDGINDAPVLMRSDVGIAMGAMGSDAAVEAADVVIMDDKPSKILEAVRISQKIMRIVKQNIVFALGVKVLFLILGAFGFMTMWGAVFADVGVTLIAVMNSLRVFKS